MQSEHQTLPIAVVWLRPSAAAALKHPLASALAAVSMSGGQDAAAAKAAAIIKDAEAKALAIIKAAETAAAQTELKYMETAGSGSGLSH